MALSLWYSWYSCDTWYYHDKGHLALSLWYGISGPAASVRLWSLDQPLVPGVFLKMGTLNILYTYPVYTNILYTYPSTGCPKEKGD